MAQQTATTWKCLKYIIDSVWFSAASQQPNRPLTETVVNGLDCLLLPIWLHTQSHDKNEVWISYIGNLWPHGTDVWFMTLLDVGGNGCHEVYAWNTNSFTAVLLGGGVVWIISSPWHGCHFGWPSSGQERKGYRQTWLHPRKSFIYSYAQAAAGQAHWKCSRMPRYFKPTSDFRPTF